MIRNLHIKATQEKHYGSLMIISHRLKDKSRDDFILKIVQYNLLLAAKCAMNAAVNQTLEEDLKNRAIAIAKQFTNTKDSTLGFLTLVELEEFNQAVNILIKVKNPGKIHIKVIDNILISSPMNVSLDFLLFMLKSGNKRFLEPIVKGIVIHKRLNRKDYYKLRNIIQKLYLSHSYRLLIPLLEKVNISPAKLLNEPIPVIAKQLMSTPKLTVSYVADLMVRYHRAEYVDVEILATLIALKKEPYISRAAKLIDKFNIEGYPTKKDLVLELLKTPVENTTELALHIMKIDKISPARVVEYIFDLKKNKNLTSAVINYAQERNIPVRDAIQILRNFQLKGIILKIEEKGYHISLKDFHIKETVYLNKRGISKQKVATLNVGHQINFRIVNLDKSKRIHLSVAYIHKRKKRNPRRRNKV